VDIALAVAMHRRANVGRGSKDDGRRRIDDRRPVAAIDEIEGYGVEIRPLLVATINRFPQRRIPTTLPTPGTESPRLTLNTPPGPSKTAVPSTTSRSVQPSMVVGLVSGTGARGICMLGLTALSIVEGAGGCAAAGGFGRALAIEADGLGGCGALAGASRAISRVAVQ